jgi:hypothetical protein
VCEPSILRSPPGVRILSNVRELSQLLLSRATMTHFGHFETRLGHFETWLNPEILVGVLFCQENRESGNFVILTEKIRKSGKEQKFCPKTCVVLEN